MYALLISNNRSGVCKSKILLCYLWTVIETFEWIGGEKDALRWPYTPSSERTVNFVFHALISVFQMEKKRFVYSGYLEREMENLSAHGPKKYTCQKNKVQHALDFVSINFLFRGKHKCLGRQLLWPFLFLELSINSKGFITLTAGAFPAERRGSVRIKGGQPLDSVFLCCWSSIVEWPLCDLQSNWKLVILEYFLQQVCKGRSRVTVSLQIWGLTLSHLWPVWPEVLLRPSKVPSSFWFVTLHNLCRNQRGHLHPSAAAMFEGFLRSSLSSGSGCFCSAPAAAREGEQCSCV